MRSDENFGHIKMFRQGPNMTNLRQVTCYLRIYTQPLQVPRQKVIKSLFLYSPEQVPRMLKIDEPIITQNHVYLQ